jgi:hypothetical protein
MSAADPASPSRVRVVLPPAVGLLVAGYWVWRSRAAWSVALLAAVAVVFLLAVFAPRAFAPVQRVLDAITGVILQVVTYVLLALVFALVFVPGRLVLRLRRRDVLQRAKDAQAATYWEPVRTIEGGDFGRQF